MRRGRGLSARLLGGSTRLEPRGRLDRHARAARLVCFCTWVTLEEVTATAPDAVVGPKCGAAFAHLVVQLARLRRVSKHRMDVGRAQQRLT